MMNVEIREATVEDAEKIINYLKIVGGETDNLTFGAEGLPITVEDEENLIRSVDRDPKSVLYFAWAKGEIIGCGSLNALPRRMGHRADLGVSVQKAYWGKGIGSMLMDHLIDYARKCGLIIINLEVRSDNGAAIHLYEKYGFKCIGISPAFFKIDDRYFDFELMYLDLR